MTFVESSCFCRYAFTPLLDNPEDEDDEEEQFVSDAFGLKMRGTNNATSPKLKSSTTEVRFWWSFYNCKSVIELLKLFLHLQEEDLKWVEDNIPAYLSDS